MELGIIGLARSGKSTVFNTLTRGRVSTASGPTAKSNIGTAKVPDGRLGVLAGIFKPKRVINAEVQYIDLLNTPEGLGKDRGISGEYFNVLQRVDALVHVVRAFEDPAVPHIQGSIDPLRDVSTLDLETHLFRRGDFGTPLGEAGCRTEGRQSPGTRPHQS